MKTAGVWLDPLPADSDEVCRGCGERRALWRGKRGLRLCGSVDCLGNARRHQTDADREYYDSVDGCRGDWRGIGDPRGYGAP